MTSIDLALAAAVLLLATGAHARHLTGRCGVRFIQGLPHLGLDTGLGPVREEPGDLADFGSIAGLGIWGYSG